MLIMMNPFIITDRYAGPEYFCDRVAETTELMSNVRNGRNTAMISLRRMGKSGLVSHFFDQEEVRNDYETFFIDIYDTVNMNDFVYLLGKEIASRLQSKGDRLYGRFLSVVRSMKLSFSADRLTGLPSLDVSLDNVSDPVLTLEQIFAFLESSEKPCIVAIDEFQQIADYPEGKKNIATLRKLVQSCRRTRFIFAGSNRRMMSTLFTSPTEPFFMSCSPLNLEPIDRHKYIEFVNGHFSKAGKHITDGCAEYVYDLFEGHTWFIQHVFNRLYDMSGKDDPACIESALESVKYILDVFSSSFQEIFVRMSERQRALLIAIAKSGKVQAPTSFEFISRFNLRSASAVQGALRPLLDDETITYMDDAYFIPNRFFSLWLARRY